MGIATIKESDIRWMYKARLVAKSFTQREGIDFNKTFSQVSNKDTFKYL